MALTLPTIHGFGGTATGGAGGATLYVTNLNDAGPGSLRAAVETSGAREIVIAIDGTIRLESRLTLTNGDCTIYCDPANSVQVWGKTEIHADNVILYNLKLRSGAVQDWHGPLWIGDAVSIFPDRVAVVNCSLGWTRDDVYVGGTNITFQHCLIGPPVVWPASSDGHGLMSNLSDRISIIECVFFGTKRHPRLRAGEVPTAGYGNCEVINNVFSGCIYAIGIQMVTADSAHPLYANVVGNVHVHSFETPTTAPCVIVRDEDDPVSVEDNSRYWFDENSTYLLDESIRTNDVNWHGCDSGALGLGAALDTPYIASAMTAAQTLATVPGLVGTTIHDDLDTWLLAQLDDPGNYTNPGIERDCGLTYPIPRQGTVYQLDVDTVYTTNAAGQLVPRVTENHGCWSYQDLTGVAASSITPNVTTCRVRLVCEQGSYASIDADGDETIVSIS